VEREFLEFFFEITTDGIQQWQNRLQTTPQKKGKYNMDPEDHTPYSQITLKPIVLIVTTQV
jgi:hypothetical protein